MVVVVMVSVLVLVLTGIEVRPGGTVSVFVAVMEKALDAVSAAGISLGVEVVEVLSAIELRPLTMLSEIV